MPPAAFSVGWLVEKSGMSRWQVFRLLRRTGVIRARKGDGRLSRLIYLAEIKAGAPQLWESIRLRMVMSGEPDPEVPPGPDWWDQTAEES